MPGGLFVNIGPLLYHFEDKEESIELTVDEIKVVLATFGLKLVKEARKPCSYAKNRNSMMHVEYSTWFFVCIRE